MKWNKACWLAFGFVLAAILVPKAWAQVEDEVGSTDFIKQRAYVGIIGTSATIDQWGDFQGTKYFTSVSSSGSTVFYPERDYIPSITRNFGLGALAGYREGPWACELSFSRSDHTATFVDSTPVTFNNPASLCSINIDFKRYFLTRLPIQPFVSAGLALPWLWVRNSSFQLSSTNTVLATGDETISGIGFNLGTGLEFYVGSNFSVVGGIFQRWTSFDQINGVEKIPFNQMYFDGNPSDIGAIEGDGLHIYAGTTYGFQL